MSTPNHEALDAGIRDVVRKLNDAGFNTTDSGDGVSKPNDWYESGEAMRCPHVACVVDRRYLASEADRLFLVLGPDWHVEASYSPSDGVCVLLATNTQQSKESGK